ncbi:LOW QUALITY PROTEIN: hypothetical protein Cgig2_032895 [Carnegiea gigantea]|uniref:Transposase MuDR plant domain-containing protein n=1 Tax=Carnegiea gigantea TaxID=171969 RepID=A0A9Q1Q8R0_9CARY|nr:LOW QUALITY PROTEIN: hypothetical protein Cgig2_032895 [Carnegiea gigantea]
MVTCGQGILMGQSVTVGDMFIDKDQWSNVIREFAIREGFCLQRIKTEKCRHIARYKNENCDWKVHCTRLVDGVTWQVKSLKGSYSYPKLQHNSLASYHWIANTLLTDFKANPTMGLKVMQEIVMERHDLDIPIHTCQRAKRKAGAKLHMLFWAACNAYTKYIYKQTMESIKKESKEAYEYTFNPELKCPDNTTNFVESFNGKIEKYRSSQSSHCWKLLEESLCKQLSRISKDWKGKVVPKVKMLLVKAEKESKAFRLTPIGREIFEALKGPTHFTVDLNTHHCDCMEETDCPKIGPPPVEIKRGRPQTERRNLLEVSPSNVASTNSLVITKGATERMGANRPSYKEKRGKRKVGRPNKEGPPVKKSKTTHQLSSSRVASQPSSSKKLARPSSSKKNQVAAMLCYALLLYVPAGDVGVVSTFSVEYKL